MILVLACSEPFASDGDDQQPIAASLEIAGDSIAQRGVPLELTAIVRDSTGEVIADAAVTWTSLDAHGATVSAGVVTPVDIGFAIIRATSDGASAQHPLRIGLGPGDAGTFRVRIPGGAGAAWEVDAAIETWVFDTGFRRMRLSSAQPAEDLTLDLAGFTGQFTFETDDPRAHLFEIGPQGWAVSSHEVSGYLSIESELPAGPGRLIGSTQGWAALELREIWPEAADAPHTRWLAFDLPLAWRAMPSVVRIEQGPEGNHAIVASAEAVDAGLENDRLTLRWTERLAGESARTQRTLSLSPFVIDSVAVDSITSADFHAGDWPAVFSFADAFGQGAGGATWGYIEIVDYFPPTTDGNGGVRGAVHARHELHDAGGFFVAVDSTLTQFELPLAPLGS